MLNWQYPQCLYTRSTRGTKRWVCLEEHIQRMSHCILTNSHFSSRRYRKGRATSNIYSARGAALLYVLAVEL